MKEHSHLQLKRTRETSSIDTDLLTAQKHRHQIPPRPLRRYTMHLTAPIQLLFAALAATQSSAVLLAAPASHGVEARASHDNVEKRSFWNSCHSCYIGTTAGGPYLECMCRRTGGLFVNAQLALNTCLANRDGKLSWVRKYVPPFRTLPPQTTGSNEFRVVGTSRTVARTTASERVMAISTPLADGLAADLRPPRCS